MEQKTSVKKMIGIGGFIALTGSMVATVYGYPAFATSGFALVFYLLLAGIFFFLPTALISAEMATGEGWQLGGVYKWVGTAFGSRWGFVAIFFQWFQITIGFVTMLYFIVGALSYLFDSPIINSNQLYKFLVVMALFWLVTYLNLKGTNFITKLTSISFSAGVILPAALLIIMAIIFVVQGNTIAVTMNWNTFFPDFSHINTLVVLVAFMLSYLGIEASAVHVNELNNAKRNYPIAVIILAFGAIVLNIFGSLSVGFVVPVDKIELNAGIMQAFEHYLTLYHLKWLLPVSAFLLALGAFGEVAAWVSGPIKGLQTTAMDGILPARFKKVNENGVSVSLVIVQGIVVSIWAAILTFGGTGGNLSFLLAMALTVVAYLSMYILLFLTYFVLRRKYGNVHREYIVPGGKFGRTIIPLLGLIMTIGAFIISFFPPSSLTSAQVGSYETILIISFVVILILPHLIYYFRPNKKK
ncbi:MAG: amino acid permease [Bacteroidetes bacterium]|nr:amino acid permease [Bacteroidota bacterium]MBL6944223.1 amino acid permease [Bacteroidales bacterium]